MFEKFTEKALNVVSEAQTIAQEMNSEYILSEHLLLALVKEARGVSLKIFKMYNISYELLYEKIKEHLKDFGADNLIDRKVNRLSGGELQRVMLGMAMMSKPDLLILDEPISGIDKNGKEQFYKKIYDLKKSNDMAIILVSHDFEYVKKYADDVILLNQVIEKEGTPDEVFKSKIFIDTFGEV